MIGREAESARIEELVAAARNGTSAVLLVRGEPGIGKTALCDFAVAHADGMEVLRVRAVPTESELAFAGLADLFRPVLDRLDAIPEPQAAALAGALALGPPSGRDPFTVSAATLSLLAALAEERPVLVAVDDAHWLDRSSAEALLFAARRLEAEAVALLVAARGDGSVFERAELPVLELSSLSPDAAAELVAVEAGLVADADTVGRLHAATGGNPLALRELVGVLTDAHLRGEDPLPDPLPFGPELERAFTRRIEELPEDIRRALLVAAIGDGGLVETVLAALAELGVDEAALAGAERLDLLEVRDDRLAVAHPLLAAAVRAGATTLELRAGHRALAGVASGRVASDRRALHLAAATASPDEDVAAALEQSAQRARERGGTSEAAHGFLEAARLSVEPDLRARRLLEAANAFRLVGELEDTFRILDEALSLAGDERLRASILHLRGRAEMWRGAAGTGYELLVRDAAAVAESDEEKAAVMLIDAVMLALERGDTDPALQAARRACELGGETGAVGLLCRAALGTVLAIRGDPGGRETLADVLDALDDEREAELPAHQLVLFAGWALVWSEDYERARTLLGRLAERARAASAPGELPFVLAALSDLDFRSGRWSSSFAGAAEAVRLAGETRQLGALPFALVALARVEAGQGREDDCRAHVDRALALADEIGAESVTLLARAVLGLLELGSGRAEAAAAELEQVRRASDARAIGDPGTVQWAPDLVEAYVRLGRGDEAAGALAELQERVAGSGRVWARAAAERCRGLLAAGEEEAHEAFEAALAEHDRLDAPFERARTELAFGERLRRARRRTEARTWLRSALETFERLGAVPWMDRARTELHASGETLRRRSDLPLQELTPQELQVALLVAQGATNREAGAALFLSPKTIEAHLVRVYRKLNVRSRTELAHAIASEDVAVGTV